MPALHLTGASGHTIAVEVKVSDEVMPGVISLPHGWGHDLPGIRLEVAARRPGANLNALLDENLRDPLSGNAVLSGVPVRLEPETPLCKDTSVITVQSTQGIRPT